MNLVQINERLKDLPLPVIQQYANGMNPEVPPYLALGELQRREISQKQAATAQGGAQGPQPSVKEQMEQKAGLMQAQQLQQQQMAQQMQQPRGPMPAPAGIPQPEAQPEMAMARGGLTSIPIRRDMFDYAGGGIIAFAGGGGVEEKYRRESEEMGAGRRMQYSPDVREFVRSQEEVSKSGYAERERARMLQQSREMVPQEPESKKVKYQIDPGQGSDTFTSSVPSVGSIGERAIIKNDKGGREILPRITPEGRRLSDEEWNEEKKSYNVEPDYTSQRPGDVFAPRYPQAGLPAALQKAAPRPELLKTPPPPGALPKIPAISTAAQSPAGLPAAAAGASPFIAEAATQARKEPTAPTAAGIISEQAALSPASMQEEAMQKRMQDQRARAAQERTAYEKSRPSGLDDLIRTFGQAGQYKGLSGMGPAYTAMQQQRRAEDLGMEKRQNELLTAIEGREYEGGKELYGARAKSMDAANKAYQDRIQTNTKTLADLAGVDQRRMDEAAQRLTQMQIAKLREATANKPTEAERIEAKYMALKAQKKDAEAEEYLNTISKIKGSGTAGVGAGRNKIMERRQEIKELESMAKNESGQYTEADSKWAAARISQLARANAQEDSEGGKAGPVDKKNPLLQ